MIRTLAIAALVAGGIAAPAAAVTYSAFSSFNGTNGNNGFTYGYTNGSSLSVFDVSNVNGPCALGVGSICLYSSTSPNIPQASIGGGFTTVTVPTDALLLHPGNSSATSVYSSFTAATAGAYTYTINLQSVGKDTGVTDGPGTGYTPFTAIGGVVTLGTRGTLPAYLSTGVLSSTVTLAAGEQFGVIIDNNGNYGGDSTGLNFTISNVPEPASWALMIAGFGLTGAALRRRRAVAVAA